MFDVPELHLATIDCTVDPGPDLIEVSDVAACTTWTASLAACDRERACMCTHNIHRACDQHHMGHARSFMRHAGHTTRGSNWINRERERERERNLTYLRSKYSLPMSKRTRRFTSKPSSSS